MITNRIVVRKLLIIVADFSMSNEFRRLFDFLKYKIMKILGIIRTISLNNKSGEGYFGR